MTHAVSEIAAMVTGLIGLIGAAATTGLPMWKVTAFIGENIVVMETRWEGLWMNCYRQANFRMQCKVYDSLLFLPPDLQAARGLMCCSLALSGLGLFVGIAGLRCMSCFQSHDRAKIIILMVAGGMQLMASACVFIPVSWTGHVIIRDFYNPLLIDAQRRELGEALYIGWVTGAFLFVSGLLFVCRRMPLDKGSFDVYHPADMLGYKPPIGKPTLMRYQPISSIPSIRSNSSPPTLQPIDSVGHNTVRLTQNVPQVMASNGALLNPAVVHNPSLTNKAAMLYQGSMGLQSSMYSSHPIGSLSTPGNSFHLSQNSTPYLLTHSRNPSMSYQSSFHPVPHTPIFIGYTASRIEPQSHSGSSVGMYI